MVFVDKMPDSRSLIIIAHFGGKKSIKMRLMINLPSGLESGAVWVSVESL